MNTTKILPEDPRLTAYALGELTGAERGEFEAMLKRDEAARRAIEEIRATAAALESALGEEPLPTVEGAALPVATAAIVSGSDPRKLDGGPVLPLIRFPQLRYILGGLAAAGFVVLIAVKGPELPSPLETSAIVKHPAPEIGPVLKASPPANLQAENRAMAATATSGIADTRSARPGEPVVPEPPAGSVASGTTATPPAVIRDAGAAVAAVAPPSSAISAGLVEQSKALHAAKTERGPMAMTPPAFQQRSAVEGASTDAKRAAAIGHGKSWGEEHQHQKGVRGGVDVSVVAASIASQSGTPAASPFAESIATPQAPLVAVNEQPIVLSPFAVESTQRSGYVATGTLAGTRVGRTRIFNTESYAYRPESDFVSAAAEPLSTFSADVDTASYANVRRFLEQGRLPPIDAVRIEELLNAFTYAYPAPRAEREAGIAGSAGRANEDRDEGVAAPTTQPKSGNRNGHDAAPADRAPFAASLEVAAAPWEPEHRLVRIGLKGREVAAAQRGPANLVFLLDVSGSMQDANKLPLVRMAMRLLLTRLRPDDRVAIVTYAGTTGLALASTPVEEREEIEAGIDALRAGGATNGGMGIQLAYDVAKANFIERGVNRVILCTDGDFNVGTTSEGELVRLIREKAKTGVFLSVFGFGMGNLKDSMLQQIADAGNGNYGYIDSQREAEKRLVEQISGTLVTIAKDVKLQVEFNPAKVARYRLIGYEKRQLANHDFKNDAVDAGEIGAGHTVTALYEVVPASAGDIDRLDDTDESQPRRYGWFSSVPAPGSAPRSALQDELLTLRVRYKPPTGSVSRKLEFPLVDRGGTFAAASRDFKFASAVAAFGMILRDSAYKGSATLEDVVNWAADGIAADDAEERTEFVELVKRAEELRR